MLTHLSIRNLAIAEHIEINFGPHMTAISGETGAGKSVLMEALGIALGKRCQGDSVRHGAPRAEVSAVFCIDSLPTARQWLKERELDEGDECILRRSVSPEGRSRAYINGQVVTRNELRELGELLMDIHSQHAHQSLLRKEQAAVLVDDYGSLQALAQEVSARHSLWREAQSIWQKRRDQEDERSAQVQLLSYQVQELDQLALQENELSELEEEQTQLAHAEDILKTLDELGNQCLDSDQGLLEQLRVARNLLAHCNALAESAAPIDRLLEDAQIALEEASNETRRLGDRIELNPERLVEVDQRLTAIYDLARKHRVSPDQIPELHRQLSDQLASLTDAEDSLEALEARMESCRDGLYEVAESLHEKRLAQSAILSKAVTAQLHRLGLSGEVRFDVQRKDSPNAGGFDQIQILASLNAGQPLKELSKVASGGELSRISLCIQVVAAQAASTPTLVFDEVDVGIGGPTAEVVGRLLRELGERTQILCITHLAQVASQAHEHLFVRKENKNGSTCSQVATLEESARIQEIARMLGGCEVSRQGVALAKEMLTARALQ